jgi:hypothetical protein
MTPHAALLAAVLVGIAGCDGFPDRYAYREPCDERPEDCCPPGSHAASDFVFPGQIICVADDLRCADAGADAGACQDAGTDAH